MAMIHRSKVVKRDGSQQEVKFDSITRRLQPLCEGGGGDLVKSEVTGRGPPKGIAQFEGKNPLFQDSPTVGEILYIGQNGCKIENKLCETTKNHSHRHFVCTFLVRGFLIPGKKLQFVTGANPGLKSDGSIIQ